MSDASSRRARIFEPEGFKVLVDFQDVMLVAGAGADDIAGLDVEVFALGPDLRLAGEDQPVFVEVVVVAIEAARVAGDAKDAGAGHLAPLGSVAGLQGTVGCSDNGHGVLVLGLRYWVLGSAPTLIPKT